MLLQLDKKYFILSMIKEVESHYARNNWTLKKKSVVNNNYKNKDGKIKTILSIWSFKYNIPSDVRLMKH